MKNLGFLAALLLTAHLTWGQAAHLAPARPSPYQLVVQGSVGQQVQREVAAGQAYLIDVRTPAEYQEKHLHNAQNVDFRAADFQQQIQQLDKTKPLYLYCRSGNRSGQAADLLHTLGYDRSYTVGSLDSLSRAGLPLARKESAPKPQGTLPVAEFAAKIKAQQPDAQIIDARSVEEFALNHVPAAINFNQQSPDYATQVQKLVSSRPVFVYSIGNGRSVALAADLRTKGFAKVYVLDGGIGAWTGSGQPLFTTAKKGLSPSDYQKILAGNNLVLVDIGSKYCGACKQVKPLLETLRTQHGAALKIVEVELEESPALISSLKTVTSFPYLILYRQGQIVLKREGLTNLKADLDAKLLAAQ